MLRFVEEITLLQLHDDGRFAYVPNWSLHYALAGGVLMDLALENRIDTDLENLVLVDATPIGDGLLDSTLAEIAAAEGHNARFWVERTAENAYAIHEEALSRLVAHGILERQDDRFLWVFRSRRYPAIDGKAVREVKLRIMEVLFSDAIPDPRDVVIICLADACGIFQGAVVQAGVDQGVCPHRAGPQAGPHRPSHVPGNPATSRCPSPPRYRDICTDASGRRPLTRDAATPHPRHPGPRTRTTTPSLVRSLTVTSRPKAPVAAAA